MSHRIIQITFFLLANLISQQVSAYGLVTDFNNSYLKNTTHSNPNIVYENDSKNAALGSWTYWSSTHQNPAQDDLKKKLTWDGKRFNSNGRAPDVWKHPALDTVSLHPGNNAFSVVEYKSNVDTVVKIHTIFEHPKPQGDGVQVFVYFQNKKLFGKTLKDDTQIFSDDFYLKKSEKIWFVVGKNGNTAHDRTKLKVKVIPSVFYDYYTDFNADFGADRSDSFNGEWSYSHSSSPTPTAIRTTMAWDGKRYDKNTNNNRQLPDVDKSRLFGGKTTLHPGRGNSKYVVAKWSGNINGPIIIQGSFQKRSSSGDGVIAYIYHNNDLIYSKTINNKIKHSFSIERLLEKDDSLEFVLGPGSSGRINYDRTILDARITYNGYTRYIAEMTPFYRLRTMPDFKGKDQSFAVTPYPYLQNESLYQDQITLGKLFFDDVILVRFSYESSKAFRNKYLPFIQPKVNGGFLTSYEKIDPFVDDFIKSNINLFPVIDDMTPVFWKDYDVDWTDVNWDTVINDIETNRKGDEPYLKGPREDLLDDYIEYVGGLIDTLIDQYGYAKVNTWYFRVFTEPNCACHWVDSIENYLSMYDRVTEKIREKLPNAMIGPGNFLNGNTRGMNSIMDHLINQSSFDFISTSFYGGTKGYDNISIKSNPDRIGYTANNLRTALHNDIELILKKRMEVHEFGYFILEPENSPQPLPDNELGARGAAWTLQVYINALQNGFDRVSHWSNFTGLKLFKEEVITGAAWLRLKMDDIIGGTVKIIKLDQHDTTSSIDAMVVEKENVLTILTSAYNIDRRINSTDNNINQNISIQLDLNDFNLSPNLNFIATQYRLAEDNSTLDIAYRDLVEENIFTEYDESIRSGWGRITTVSNDDGTVNKMATRALKTASLNYIDENKDRYYEILKASLREKSFPSENGDNISLNGRILTINSNLKVPEVRIIKIRFGNNH